MHHRQFNLRTVLHYVFGWLFILLGVAGLVLPFLQGFLFLFIGLFLLARVSPRIRLLRMRLRRRYPKFGKYHDLSHAWFHRQRAWFRRRFAWFRSS